jgi:hypothetical protein
MLYRTEPSESSETVFVLSERKAVSVQYAAPDMGSIWSDGMEAGELGIMGLLPGDRMLPAHTVSCSTESVTAVKTEAAVTYFFFAVFFFSIKFFI